MKNRKKMAGTIAMIMALSLGYNADMGRIRKIGSAHL